MEVVTSRDLIRTLEYDTDAYDIVVARNDIIVDEEFVIDEDDVVAVMLVPKGGGGGGVKSVLRVVALIAVAIVAPQLASGFMWTVGSNSAMLYYAVTAATVVSGSLLINTILPPPVPDRPGLSDLGSYSTSNTYSWDPSTNVYQQGISVPKLFGTHYVNPPIISKYVESIDDKQYLNVLYAVSDGVISSIDDITINDNPISYYESVWYQYTLGNNDQPLISSFNDTRYTKTVTQKLNASDWRKVITDGDAVKSLMTCLVFPRGLYYADDNGNVVSYSVKVQLQYSSDGVNWVQFGGDVASSYESYAYYGGQYYQVIGGYWYGYWEPISGLPAGATYGGSDGYVSYWYKVSSYTLPYTTISNSTTSTFRRTYKLENLAAGKYYVRCKFYEAPSSSSRYGSDCYFEYLEETIADDFIYPNTALFALRALATDQLSGSMPSVKMRVTQGTTNPADIVLAMLAEYGVYGDRIDSSKFTEWRTYCTSKNLSCNIYFDQTTNLRKAIDMVSIIGRARVEQFGSRFSVIIDKPDELPVQGFMFGMGNILKDSFKEEFLPIADRANVVEVTYYDESDSNTRKVVEVSNESYDSEYEENRTQLNLVGCTNREQAIKQGKFLLNCNRYLTNTATWESDIDALVCRFGDVVQVSHDVPQWGVSGRVVSATTATVTLDRPVEMSAGKTYYIQIKSNADNSVTEKQVEYNSSPSDTVTLMSVMTEAALEHDIYSFGEVGKVVKLMRIVSIGTSGNDLRRTIRAIEYLDEVYDDATIISPDVVSNIGLYGLYVSDFIVYADDRSVKTMMSIRWSGSSLGYVVKYRYASDNEWSTVTTYDTSVSIEVSKTGTYHITVTDLLGNAASTFYDVLGKLAPPEAVSDLILTENSDSFGLSWKYPDPPIDFDHFDVQYSTGSGWFTDGTTTSKIYEISIKGSGINHVQVLAVDSSGVKSAPTSVSATPSIATVTGLASYYQNGNTYLNWDRCETSRGAVRYEIRKGDSWTNGLTYIVTTDTKALADSNARYMVRAVYTTAYGVDIYSEADDSITIDEARLSANVIATFEDSSTGWTGTKSTDCIVYDNEITLADATGIDSITDFDSVFPFDWYGGIAAYGRYETSNTITLASQQLCHCSIDITAFAVNEGFHWDDITDLDSVTNLDGYVERDFEIIPLISISTDGTTWGEFKRFYAGDYYAKSFRFAVDLYSYSMMIRPVVSQYTYSVDMDDRIEKGTSASVGTSGLTITYSKPFQVTPNTQITIINAIAGDDAKLTSASASGFTILIYNGGTTVARSINWISQGY
jgi:predicted phage tail protein